MCTLYYITGPSGPSSLGYIFSWYNKVNATAVYLDSQASAAFFVYCPDPWNNSGQ